MIVTPLGHTEFLVDVHNSHDENVRILIDSWLSDFVVGDLMERRVKVKLDPGKVGSIDIVYISHSHTDHFDPYTLVEIYQYTKPILLLPFTLEYLIPLIREYVQDIRIEILHPGKALLIKGIEVTGYIFPQNEITNEDDVMMIAVENEKELLFAEVDTLPEEDDLEVQKKLYSILTKRSYDTVCYIASRNELAGELPLLDLPPKKRKGFRDTYILGRKDEMHFAYEKYEYEDFMDFPNIFTIPNLVRGFVGQGMNYPESLSHDLSRIQIFPLQEIASMESDIAEASGYEFPQKALLPGRQYIIEGGKIEAGRKECPIGELVFDRNHGNLETTDNRVYANGPISPRDISDIQDAKDRIVDILNHKFLPYWSASPVASLRSAMIENGGVYRIGCKTLPLLGGVGGGTPPSLAYKGRNPESIIFEYSFASTEFQEVPYIEGMRIDESYWLDDILDFLDGKQDLYSNFWHKLDNKTVYRLWTCLGANFCNHDLVIQKYRLHFERAVEGKMCKEYFENINLF